MPRIRVGAAIMKDDLILLMHRFKNGREYYVFPGGKDEEGESIEQTLTREIAEEVSLTVNAIGPLLLEFSDEANKTQLVYIVTDFSGEVALGGEEKERMNEHNQYYPEWHDIKDIHLLPNFYPPNGPEIVQNYFLKKG
jgi:ADP-ribose pyrophosphatase YjhB (NUDIX family)